MIGAILGVLTLGTPTFTATLVSESDGWWAERYLDSGIGSAIAVDSRDMRLVVNGHLRNLPPRAMDRDENAYLMSVSADASVAWISVQTSQTTQYRVTAEGWHEVRKLDSRYSAAVQCLNGICAGGWNDPKTFLTSPFIYLGDKLVHPDLPPGTSTAEIFGASSDGSVMCGAYTLKGSARQRPLIWRNRHFEIPAIPTDRPAIAASVSAHGAWMTGLIPGAIAGPEAPPNPNLAFVLHAGKATILPRPSLAGFKRASLTLRGINDKGQAAGNAMFLNSNGQATTRPFFWDGKKVWIVDLPGLGLESNCGIAADGSFMCQGRHHGQRAIYLVRPT